MTAFVDSFFVTGSNRKDSLRAGVDSCLWLVRYFCFFVITTENNVFSRLHCQKTLILSSRTVDNFPTGPK